MWKKRPHYFPNCYLMNLEIDNMSLKRKRDAFAKTLSRCIRSMFSATVADSSQWEYRRPGVPESRRCVDNLEGYAAKRVCSENWLSLADYIWTIILDFYNIRKYLQCLSWLIIFLLVQTDVNLKFLLLFAVSFFSNESNFFLLNRLLSFT